MGCGTSKASSPGGRNEFKSAKGLENTSRAVEKKKFIPQVGVGRPVGGGAIPADRREAQLAAAEKRAMKEASRGLGQAQRGLELNDSARKQELIGRIHAVYNVCLFAFCAMNMIVDE